MKDQTLIDRLRARDEGGVEELLTHYTPLMRYIVSPILPDKRDQEECISEVALRLWESMDQYDPDRGSWTAWLTAMTRNTALNRARKNRAQREGEEALPLVPSPEFTPEEQMLREEAWRQLRLALEELSHRDRLLFYRKYYYRQPTQQIAAELGMTTRAVEGKLYRIRKKLRTRLEGEEHG